MPRDKANQRSAVPLRPPVCSMLAGRRPTSKMAQTFLAKTYGDDGWRRLTPLSVRGVLAASDHAAYGSRPTTRTVANMARCLPVISGLFHKLRLHMEELPLAPSEKTSLTGSQATVGTCAEEEVDYPETVSGIQHELVDESAVIPRWERQLGWLREGPA